MKVTLVSMARAFPSCDPGETHLSADAMRRNTEMYCLSNPRRAHLCVHGGRLPADDRGTDLQANTGAGHTDYGSPMRMMHRLLLPPSGRTFDDESEAHMRSGVGWLSHTCQMPGVGIELGIKTECDKRYSKVVHIAPSPMPGLPRCCIFMSPVPPRCCMSMPSGLPGPPLLFLGVAVFMRMGTRQGIGAGCAPRV